MSAVVTVHTRYGAAMAASFTHHLEHVTTNFLIGHIPVVGGVLVGLVFLVALLRRLGRGSRIQRDPQRVFTASQRRHGFTRAGNQCEHKGLFWFRCTAAPTHGDHIYPWSRGGATSMANFAALCARHNLKKSNHVPSWFYMHRLEARRRKYFIDQHEVRIDHRMTTPPVGRF